MIKHIFSDMDGTLLNSGHKISDKTIQFVRESNIPFTLVSGRAPQQMEEHINLLGLDSPQIGFNGGIIFSIKNNGSLHVLKESPMDINVCKNLLYILGVNFPEASLCFFDEYNCFTFKIDEGINMFREVSPQNPIIADINSFFSKNRKILKVTVICPKQNLIDKIISLLNSINLKTPI